MRRWISGRLRGGEFLLGCFVATPQLSTCEVLGACGFDVLVADAEHAPLGPADVRTIVAGADLAGLPALVRLSDDSAASIQYALDAGAAGVIVPRVNTAAQAAAVVCRGELSPARRPRRRPGAGIAVRPRPRRGDRRGARRDPDRSADRVGLRRREPRRDPRRGGRQHGLHRPERPVPLARAAARRGASPGHRRRDRASSRAARADRDPRRRPGSWSIATARPACRWR